MKKLCFLLCCVLALQLFSGCTKKNENFQVPVNFYYSTKEITYNTPDSVIQAETREGAGYADDVEAFIQAYLQGPVSSDLQRIMPSDVYLVSCEVEGDTVCIVLSTQISKLSGISLLTACSALFLSLQDFAGTQTLQISADETLLDDKDMLTITADDIVLVDAVNVSE